MIANNGIAVCFLFVPLSLVDLWVGMGWRWLLLVGGHGWLVLGFAVCACACVARRCSAFVGYWSVCVCRVRRSFAVLLAGCMRAACWPRHAACCLRAVLNHIREAHLLISLLIFISLHLCLSYSLLFVSVWRVLCCAVLSGGRERERGEGCMQHVSVCTFKTSPCVRARVDLLPVHTGTF